VQRCAGPAVGTSAQAGQPPTALKCCKAGSGATGVLLLRAFSVDAVASSTMPGALGLACCCRAIPTRERRRVRAVTNIKSAVVQRKRGELRRNAVGRRATPVTAARRRLGATGPGGARDSASHLGPRDPRFDYLTHSHD
jgi:hypothetical protein